MSEFFRANFKIIFALIALTGLLVIVIGAFSLIGAPGEPPTEQITSVPSLTSIALTLTVNPTGTITTTPSTSTPFPTSTSIGLLPTSIRPPTSLPGPTRTLQPSSIVIISPQWGNIIANNVQVLGSASHPQFLQYSVEYGPDPNPGNLWFPVTNFVQQPIINGLLGVWNTNSGAVPDGKYQLRLRVFLLDGSQQVTVVGNLTVQNRVATPVPTNTSVPPPVAAFTQDRTQGYAPLVISFLNQSQGQINAYSWDFGDGGVSSGVNPVHTYVNPGSYIVRLTVAGPGGSSNVTRQINVTSASAPVASFTTNTLSGPAPLNVQFTNTSTGTISSQAWDFGDGSNTNQANPSHTFTNVGSYNVILTVSGPGGASSVIRQITVENPQVPAPTSSFTANPETGDIPLGVQFTSTSGGQITQYLWDFNGDGITDSTSQNPIHTYQVEGNYNVKLVVIGPGGQSSSQKLITAKKPPQAPTAAFDLNPASGDAPLNVQFTDQSTGDITSYAWDFNGDAITDSTDKNPQFNFTVSGTYPVKLTVSGPGGSNFIEHNVSVTDPIQPPVANFTPSTTSGQAPIVISFTNTSQGQSITNEWDFDGDGVTDSNEVNPSYEYTQSGIYDVSLIVSNSAGSDTKTTQITISDVVVMPPPAAAFTANPNVGAAPLLVQFTNQSIGDVTSWEWDFQDDGSVDSTDENPEFTFNTAGTYNTRLTVSGVGGTSTITNPVTVNPALQPPVAAFTANPGSGNAPLLVSFADSSSGTIDTWEWDFESDGTVDSNDQNPQFTFNADGDYTTTLTVTNAAGSDSTTQVISVTAALQPPVAAFSANPTSGTAPLLVSFADSSSGTIDTWEWDFESDGTVDSNDQNPQFTFNADGDYTTTLTVSNAAGSDSTTQVISVTAALQPPVAAFTANPTSGTAPLLVSFADSSSGTVDTWEWDFESDGIVDSNDQNAQFTFNTAGDYTTTLTVTNAAGSNSTTQVISVTAAPVPPTASFTADPASGTAPLFVQFLDSSSGTVDTWEWDFESDGIVDSNDQNAQFTFNTAGDYTTTLTVTNAAGSNSTTQVISVTAALQPPVAAFSANPASGTAPLFVQFLDSSGGTVDTWEWDFESDGIVDSNDQNAQFTFNTAGDYTTTLTVTNAAGSDSTTQVINVTAAPVPPTASFTAAPETGDMPLLVQFTDQSSGDIDTWEWDFESDGIVDSNDQNPQFTYNAAGTYTASLTVTNGAGSNTATTTITVNDVPTGPNVPAGVVIFTTQRDGNYEIYSSNTDGTNLTNLTNHPANDKQASVSPDGSRVAFVSDRDGNNEIYILNLSDLSVTNITNDAGNDQMPAWSGNGSKIVFVSNRNGDNDIFVMGADGSNPVALVASPASETYPSWSPDNNKIAYVSDEAGNNEIYVVNAADGSPLAQLTTDPNDDTQPIWSPDGNKIAFTSNRFGDYDIYTMNASDGSGILQLTTDSASDYEPAWSSDGAYLLFTSTRLTNINNIYIMASSDGSDVVAITDSTASDEMGRWKP